MPVEMARGMLPRAPMTKHAMVVLAAVAVIRFFLVSSCNIHYILETHAGQHKVTPASAE